MAKQGNDGMQGEDTVLRHPFGVRDCQFKRREEPEEQKARPITRQDIAAQEQARSAAAESRPKQELNVFGEKTQPKEKEAEKKKEGFVESVVAWFKQFDITSEQADKVKEKVKPPDVSQNY